ncbi:PREDICTED: 60S ribosomal protein L21-like [Priapulus caudatus]|uniref:60S ribosomal protein L21 n=1 Tax=Priapulus caudatus TaxID=37621 RepID=A0ABM1EZB1_PRICU|nr:PREDICTED: 60S ribosomal protein L21-like [Priapulus caudatus]XP_014677533.1 PREDICTED: 60S ribosomal protein L21-like [Priapulus caudatus]
MTNSKGYRRGTRYMFSRQFRKHGVEPLSTFLTVYKKGDLVDIKGNGCFQKGMPHKVYHGKTGRVYNITQHALGVIVNKRVRGRIIAKRINVRVEHVKHSNCRRDFLRRVQDNDVARRVAKEKGSIIKAKRQPKEPLGAHHVRTRYNKPQLLEPIPYEFIA